MRLGKPLPFSTPALEQMAVLTPLDLEAARAHFLSTVPPRWRGLWEAPVRGAAVTAETPYAWDPRRGRYVTRRGQILPPLLLRNQVVEPLIGASRAAQRILSGQLQAKEITLAQWQAGMMDQVKQTQIASAVVANGGQKNTNDSDREEIALLLLALWLLLRDFSTQIQTGRQALNGTLLVRSDLYASAARGTWESMNEYFARVYLGQTQERRVLGDAEHCESDDDLLGCVELAAKGWQPIGSLPRIGKTPCRSNCRCHKEYR